MKKRSHKKKPDDPNAPKMSFRKIAREMGISMEGARYLYNNGMRKLRSNPEARRLFEAIR